jgi:hypothetical protein
MGAFRQEKIEARGILHEYMSFSAVLFTPPYDPLTSDRKDVTVRVHDKFLALGDLKGTNFNYAELEAVAPQGIFLVSEVMPGLKRGMILSVEPGLAYQVDSVKEPDNITIPANLIRMQAAKTTGFPIPGVP